MRTSLNLKFKAVEQQQTLPGLLSLLKYGSFFRNQSGLNSLPSIRELNKILNLPTDFEFEIKPDGWK